MGSIERPPAAEEERKLHAVIVPCPLQGHINPMLLFSKALIAHHNFTITFVSNHHMYTHIKHTHPELSSYGNLHLQWVDNGLPPDFDYTHLAPRWAEFLQGFINMQAPLKALMESLNGPQSMLPPISCVIYGCFFPWAHYAAKELSIPSVFFWTQSLAVFSIYYHAPMLIANGFFPYKLIAPDSIQEDSDLVSYIPGIPPLHRIYFPGFLRVEDPSNLAFQLIEQQFATVKECKTVIVNSFHELEKETYKALQMEPLAIYVVGPLLPYLHKGSCDEVTVEEDEIRKPESLLKESRHQCLMWLDKQKKHSVVYISFGTIAAPSWDELQGIASAIKQTKQPYLWVLRRTSSCTDVSEILPNSFLEETGEHGMIVAWAPQLEVLAHPAVGAFLTHCGWNSTLESLSMGVPMIPLPDKTDQPTNCKFVVDVWRVGMALKRNSNGRVDCSEVKRVLCKVLQDEEGQDMRRRACTLKEVARRAAQDDKGPSILELHKFAQAIRNGPPFL